MIERQSGKRRPDFRPTQDDCDFIEREQLAQKLREKLRGARGQFRRLEQDAVAGRQRRHQRHDRQLERIVPRAHDADDPHRLVQDVRAASPQLEGDRNFLGLHPFGQMFLGVADGDKYWPDLGEQRFLSRPIAEIAVDHGRDPLGVALDRSAQFFEIRQSIVESCHLGLLECLPLQSQKHGRVVCIGKAASGERFGGWHADRTHGLVLNRDIPGSRPRGAPNPPIGSPTQYTATSVPPGCQGPPARHSAERACGRVRRNPPPVRRPRHASQPAS